jgi:hypothetical protein
VKALMRGGRSLLFYALCKIWFAWGRMLHEPCWGRWIEFWDDRCL